MAKILYHAQLRHEIEEFPRITSFPIQTKICPPDIGLYQKSKIVWLDTFHQSISIEVYEVQVFLHRLVAKMMPYQVILREGIHAVFLQVTIAQLLRRKM